MIESGRDMARRRGEVSRLEGLSDAVFGFAITLLVVSLAVPTHFSELAVQSIVAGTLVG